MDVAKFTLGNKRIRIKHDLTPTNPRKDSCTFGALAVPQESYSHLGDEDGFSDLVYAVCSLAEKQGVNVDDKYIDCPYCDGLSGQQNRGNDAWKNLPHDSMVRITFDGHDQSGRPCIHEAELFKGMIDWGCEGIKTWQVECDHCDEDGDIENAYPGVDDLPNTVKTLQMLDPDEEYTYMLPVCIYEHSGTKIWTGHPGIDWDSGYLGVIWTTAENAKEEGFDDAESAHKIMSGEIETLDSYVQGEVYGFICETLRPCPDDWDADEWADIGAHWQEEDSCWGFYSDQMHCPTLDDFKKCGMADHWDETWQQVITEGEQK